MSLQSSFLNSLDIYSEVGLWDHMIIPFLIFEKKICAVFLSDD